MKKLRFILVFNLLSFMVNAQSVSTVIDGFIKDYQAMDIAWMGYDYREYFQVIPAVAVIDQRLDFVEKYETKLKALDRKKWTPAENQRAVLLQYYLDLHRQRFTMEKQFKTAGDQEIPADGFFKMANGNAWYRFFILAANGIDISPEEIFRYGQSEVDKIHSKMAEIQKRLGFEKDSAGFQNYLRNASFFLTNRDTIVARYEKIEARVRTHLVNMFEPGSVKVPEIACMTWPDAGPYTPPARYLSAADNAYGKAVFQFNFYGERHNTRAMDWIFMHEAIPGHHFQRWMINSSNPEPLTDMFFEGGILEGWATYVEYFGEEMGLYRDDLAWLGKWEWDLVRSARLVISAGIHHYGWTKAQALDYWKKNVPGQDDIADREITRCTNWPAQVLTYKIGAKTIFEIRDEWEKREGRQFDVKKFHSRLLTRGDLPLAVLKGLGVQ